MHYGSKSESPALTTPMANETLATGMSYKLLGEKYFQTSKYVISSCQHVNTNNPLT